MPTIKDVAEKAGVSVATVSAVINKNSEVNVSKELTSKVEKAVKELNYRPNRIARALSKKKTHTIAYITPSISNMFFSQMAELIEQLAFAREYGVYLCNTGGNKKRIELYINNLIGSKVDGVITTLTWGIREYKFIEKVKQENIPIVGLAGARVTEEIDTVVINDIKSGELAAEHLVSLGYKNIGFIGVKRSKTTVKRIKGYRKILNKFDLKLNDDNIELGENFTREEGFYLIENLLEKNSNLDSVIVYNDEMAAGVIDKLKSLEKNIPQDIAIIGFDDSVARFTHPKLTTMSLPKKHMAELAVNMLWDRIENKDIEIRNREVYPELIRRNTT
ncbi:MAG: LacI family DNA-binding transcriptional regulator [Halanaerobiaceae bacterium]